MRAFPVLFSLLLFASCNNNSPSLNSNTSNYEQAKATIEDRERLDPTEFLSAKFGYRKNLVDKWVIEGTITNHANLAKYKDVVVRLKYYTKTDTEIGTDEKTIIEFFPPNSHVDFKIRTEKKCQIN